jgi:hypothetical protein
LQNSQWRDILFTLWATLFAGKQEKSRRKKMLELSIDVAHIDYEVFTKKILPILRPSNRATNAVAAFFAKPFWNWLFNDKFKENLAVEQLISHKEYIKEFIENNIPLTIGDMDFENRDGIKIKVTIEDVRYNDGITLAYPLFKKNLESTTVMGDIFKMVHHYVVKMAHAAFDVLPHDKRDELTVYLVNRFALLLVNSQLANMNTGIKLKRLKLSGK